jgi:glucosamine-6-phosphate deaminase
MKISIYDTATELGNAAGTAAAQLIRESIQEKNTANIILATGTSQFETLKQLTSEKNIDWSKVTMFHLDEYIGLPITHPASFRRYLQERFISKVGPLRATFLIDGEADPVNECERLGNLIAERVIHVALVGIGENAHLAFNDPPADFETLKPYIVVELDGQCRKQQMNEGWFAAIDEVPAKAISMSINQILKSKNIICSVPGERKAIAVKNCLEQEISNLYPASILQSHPRCTLYLDRYSATLLHTEIRSEK